MAQRITRAKRKIAATNIPYRIPQAEDLPARLAGVLSTVYLIFNEGYLPSSGAAGLRTDLCAEAIRLGRVLRDLLPDDPEVTGLLALMLLIDARAAARFGDGALVPLAEQDRALWDSQMIAEGHELVRWCLGINRPGHYQILAAINAVHDDAASSADTDWQQILALYDQLLAVAGSPIVALNRAIAVAEVAGPQAGLDAVDVLDLSGYHPFHATRAELLRRLGRSDDSQAAYDRAIELAGNPAERAYLAAQRAKASVGPA